MKKCAIIIVTYNRLELLKENVKAIMNLDGENFEVFYIDNASQDGTDKYLISKKNDKLHYFNTGSNLGGAGGFAYGIEKALKYKDYDYVWIMDDDSIPQGDSLSSLMNKASKLNDKFSYLASLVYWKDGNLCLMNTPKLAYTKKNSRNIIKMSSEMGLLPIWDASFVGFFANAKYIRKNGLPISEFFIYGDDIEYSRRLSKDEQAYLDLDSKIIHLCKENIGADIALADYNKIDRYYYQSRNGVYIARKYHFKLKRFNTIIKRIGRIILLSKDHKLKRINTLIKGSIAGIFFNPKIKYIENEGESSLNEKD